MKGELSAKTEGRSVTRSVPHGTSARLRRYRADDLESVSDGRFALNERDSAFFLTGEDMISLGFTTWETTRVAQLFSRLAMPHLEDLRSHALRMPRDDEPFGFCTGVHAHSREDRYPQR